jgi:DNA polymerase
MAFYLPSWAEGRTAVWHPSFPAFGIEEAPCPELKELFTWVLQGGLIEAHNAWFECCVWQNIMETRYGWPPIRAGQWRCSAAKAASHSLPRKLDDAAQALGLSVRKDPEGVKTMKESAIKRMFKPRKARKKEREAVAAAGKTLPLLWWESPEELAALWAYCRQDVVVEVALSKALPDLSDKEEAIFTLDQTVNRRGFRLDRAAVTRALTLIDQETKRGNAELETVTGGVVKKATQRDQMKAWLETEGLSLDDTQAMTLDAYLAEGCQEELTPAARQAIELMRALGRSSTAKYEAMAKWMGTDDRIHGSILYHGASTGRWTGVGPQPHNFPKGTLTGYTMEEVWAVLLHEPAETIASLFEVSVLEVLSHALRGAIVPSPGKRIFCADYASIEARVVMWLAGETDALEKFRTGADIYCDMADAIYGYTTHKDTHPKERSIGKLIMLGLGYQMGWRKFQTQCAAAGIVIEDEFAQMVVETYREKYWRVKQLWQDQERAAIYATEHPGLQVPGGYVRWVKEERFLYCYLPSGRRLAYPDAEVRLTRTPWDALKPALTYRGVDAYSRKWKRQTAYGGMLTENCWAEGTPVLTTRGWIPIQHIRVSDKVWDGLSWVNHDGLLYRGQQSTLCVDGLYVTANHLLLSSQGWVKALHVSGLDWASCRRPRYFWFRRMGQRTLALARCVFRRTLEDVSSTRYSDDGRTVSSMPRASRASTTAITSCLERYANSLLQFSVRLIPQIWGTWNCRVRTLGRLQQFLVRYGSNICAGLDIRPQEQQRELRALKLSLGHETRTAAQYPSSQSQGSFSRNSQSTESWASGRIQPILPGPTARVYDLKNCGPRHQFVVAGGRISHNCTQAIARDILADALVRCENTGVYLPVLSVHDELVCEAHPTVGNVREFEQLVAKSPEWAVGLPIAVEGWAGERYHK